MKIFVTGASGFIGKHLCCALLAAGYEVTGLFRSAATGVDSPEQIVLDDILDLQPSDLKEIEVVIHLAGVAHDQAASKSEYERVNVHGTQHLLKCSVDAGVRRLVFLSSVKAIAEQSTVPLVPDIQPDPEDDYGRSKLAAENLLLSAKSIETCVVRVPLVYGQGVKGNFLKLTKIVQNGIPLPVLAIDNRRSYLAIENLCDLLKVICNRPGELPPILHCADAGSISLPELLKSLCAASGSQSRVFWMPKVLVVGLTKLLLGKVNASKLFGNLELDVRHTQETVCWSPKYSMEECLPRLFENQ